MDTDLLLSAGPKRGMKLAAVNGETPTDTRACLDVPVERSHRAPANEARALGGGVPEAFACFPVDVGIGAPRDSAGERAYLRP